ncbi:Glu S.griseus protease inhibitor, putative [Ricinus communis]|uniref:Glu S.griseus protease inhibitor, putative n=1 Tax=Ricinus communis TaxID=3988 RepID=B9RTD8_RICCO|nr:Glu S.griseus protease inhibitor, putative [Ricinus communis]
MSIEFAGKSSWPELVGNNGEAATAIIMRENPRVKANTVKEGSPVSGDFRSDRVRVFIDDNHIVTLVPKIG